MPFLMIRNDITKVQADALVNPANERLMEGRGTSRAIYLAAGEEKLMKACESIGYCAPGKAAATPAFDLPAKFIIHAVCPFWRGGSHGEEKLLYSAYMEAMLLAEEKGLRSIAFPLLSSGNYGYPKDQAMKTAVHAISDFLMDHELMVYLVLYDRSAVSVSRKLFAAIDEYIDDHYVEENDESFAELSEELKFEEDAPGSSASFRESVSRQMPLRNGAAGPDGRSGEGSEENREAQQPLSWEEFWKTGRIIPEKKASRSPGEAVRSRPEETRQFRPAEPGRPRPVAKKRSLEELMEHMDETFSQMLLRMIDERQLKDSYVYKRANVDRRHFSKIRNDRYYAPAKKTVIAFAIALELSLDETNDLLMRAGFAFSRSSKFDVIICYFIENGQYDIYKINETLFAYGQPVLGEA